MSVREQEAKVRAQQSAKDLERDLRKVRDCLAAIVLYTGCTMDVAKPALREVLKTLGIDVVGECEKELE